LATRCGVTIEIQRGYCGGHARALPTFLNAFAVTPVVDEADRIAAGEQLWRRD
jgi:hypothetical protein